MGKNKETLYVTKEMLEDFYIIAAVYKTTVDEVIRALFDVEYNIEYVA